MQKNSNTIGSGFLPHLFHKYSSIIDSNDKIPAGFYLNRYALSKEPISKNKSIHYILSILSDSSDFSFDSHMSDCFRILFYSYGLLSSRDLEYYLGFDKIYINKLLSRDIFELNNYYKYNIYGSFCGLSYFSPRISKQPFLKLKERPKFSYGEKTISHKYVPHIASSAISCLLIGLYCCHFVGVKFHFTYELPVGCNTLLIDKNKIGSILTTDIRVTISLNNSESKNIYIEQDMLTENANTLFDKLYGYYNAGILHSGEEGKSCILFSFSQVKKLKTASFLPLESLTLVIYVLAYEVNKIIDSIDPCFAISTESLLNNIFEINNIEFSAFCLEHDLEIRDVLLANGLKIEYIVTILLRDYGAMIKTIVDQAIEILGYYTNNHVISIMSLIELMKLYNKLKTEKDVLGRMSFNKSLYHSTYLRMKGLYQKILANIYQKEQIQNQVIIFPILKGYHVWLIPTPVITNDISFLLWNRNSKDVSVVEEHIKNRYGTVQYMPFSNEYHVKLQNLTEYIGVKYPNTYFLESYYTYVSMEHISDLGAVIRITIYLLSPDINTEIYVITDTYDALYEVVRFIMHWIGKYFPDIDYSEKYQRLSYFIILNNCANTFATGKVADLIKV